jgi:hypothetical protein
MRGATLTSGRWTTAAAKLAPAAGAGGHGSVRLSGGPGSRAVGSLPISHPAGIADPGSKLAVHRSDREITQAETDQIGRPGKQAHRGAPDGSMLPGSLHAVLRSRSRSR